MINKIRYHLLSLSIPIQKIMQKIGKPEPIVTYAEVVKALSQMEPGDCILTKENYRLTNMFIPGYWSHAAIYVGDSNIVEAVAPKARIINAFDMMLKKDEFVVFRPNWMSRAQRELAAIEAKTYVGMSYDYLFDTNKALYCSELVYQAYKEAFEYRPPLIRSKTFGVYNINPDHFSLSDSMSFISHGGGFK